MPGNSLDLTNTSVVVRLLSFYFSLVILLYLMTKGKEKNEVLSAHAVM